MIAEKDVLKNINTIFYPRSVAVVGTNNVVGTVPCDIFHSIINGNFAGPLYPVSPREQQVADVKAYKYVTDIEAPVDLAILVFPSSVCNLALEQCGRKGIKTAVVISAGFREVGEKGREKEQELLRIAANYGISFIGPNCLGVINTDPISRLNASFARQMPREGSIAFLSQSGALCTAVLDFAYARHIGFSKFVSFGNKADITEMDLMRYLKNDTKTSVILLYLEEIRDGKALMSAAEEVWRQARKPVLLLKSGRTSQGASAAASHTGSLAGSDAVCDAAFRQAGIIRCGTIDEMFNKAIAFAYQPIPRGPRVALVTNAGGPGVLATDAAVTCGLTLAGFSPQTTALFKKKLPVTANIKNPVDLIGDAHSDRYAIALSALLDDEEVDGILVILTPQSMTDIEEIAKEICAAAARGVKPVYASFMGEYDVARGVDVLRRNNIPHYSLPEAMCESFAGVFAFGKQIGRSDDGAITVFNVDKEAAGRILAAATQRGARNLPQTDAVAILRAYGIPVPPQELARSRDEAAGIAGRIGFPVVFKVASEEIVHKSDIGGVIVGINDADQARQAYDDIIANAGRACPSAKVEGVLVVKMVQGGQEVILGMSKDPSFGPVVMFGMGGIFVEILRDVSFMVAPVKAGDVRRMVEGIKSFPLLKGVRGRRPRDLDSIRECIGRLSQLAIDFPCIKELDINPLIVKDQGEGSCAVDARILL